MTVTKVSPSAKAERLPTQALPSGSISTVVMNLDTFLRTSSRDEISPLELISMVRDRGAQICVFTTASIKALNPIWRLPEDITLMAIKLGPYFRVNTGGLSPLEMKQQVLSWAFEFNKDHKSLSEVAYVSDIFPPLATIINRNLGYMSVGIYSEPSERDLFRERGVHVFNRFSEFCEQGLKRIGDVLSQ